MPTLDGWDWVVVGNLPYHISSRLIFQYLPQRGSLATVDHHARKSWRKRRSAGAERPDGRASRRSPRACGSRGCSMCPPAPLRRLPVRSAVIQLQPKAEVMEVDEEAYSTTAVFGAPAFN